jgi:hypothetical protein
MVNCDSCSQRVKVGDKAIVGGPRSMGGLGVLCERCCKRRKAKPTAMITKEGYRTNATEKRGSYESTWEDWTSRHWETYGAREHPETDMPEGGS